MIQITAQMRVLVAIEPVDGRKGIDSLARLARRSSRRIRFPDACSCFAAAAGRRSGSSPMTGKDTGWRRSGFPKGVSHGGRKRVEPAKPLEAYEAQLLMAAGDVSRVRAAPMWRRVNAAQK